MGKVLAICISDKRGIQKHEVDGAYLRPEYGIEGDAHAGNWHRQVSLLGAIRFALCSILSWQAAPLLKTSSPPA